jgi:hypothetical protein
LLADGGNLLLQCTTGREGHIRKSWVFKYEIDGKRHEMGLGPLHTRGLGEARAEAKRLRQLLLDRVDPLVERRKADQARIAERAKTVTFKDCAEAYWKAHEDSLAEHQARAAMAFDARAVCLPEDRQHGSQGHRH